MTIAKKRNLLSAWVPTSMDANAQAQGLYPMAPHVLALQVLLNLLHRRAGADQVAVAVRVVNAADAGPEFVRHGPGGRVGGLLAAISMGPLVGSHRAGGVRGVLQ